MDTVSGQMPHNAVDFIRRCIDEGKIFWTYHVNMRLQERTICRDEISAATDSYEIIESYPRDRHLPSCLVLAAAPGGPLHIVFALDVEDDNVRIVTAYRPDPLAWSNDFRKRRGEK